MSNPYQEALGQTLIERTFRERIVLVGVTLPPHTDEETDASLDELALLVDTAGADAVATLTQRRDAPDPAWYLGKGKAEELRQVCLDVDADTVVFDNELSPAQQYNLEKLLGRTALDRTAVILDIFAQNAHTLEGKAQVELALLRYRLPRLRRGAKGAFSQQGAGIGTRGPGETKLEVDRRRITRRIAKLEGELRELGRTRENQRKSRERSGLSSVTIVGYTNAGKSTLFRSLTGADAYVADQLFATLDPLVRRVMLPGGSPVVLADTVGFIRELPHELVAAFQSTLTEAREATLLLHVIDASDPRRDERIDQVNAVLTQVGAGEIPQIRVYNKIDRLEGSPRIERDGHGQVSSAWISAAKRQGLEELLSAIAERLSRFARLRRVVVPPQRAGAVRARLFAAGVVRGEESLPDGGVALLAELPDGEIGELGRIPGVEVADCSDAGQTCAPDGGYLQSASSARHP